MLFALRCKFKVIRRSDDAKPLHLVERGVALQAESGGCSARTSELPIGALAGGENSSAHLFFKRRICDPSNHPRNIRCNGVEYRSSSLTTRFSALSTPVTSPKSTVMFFWLRKMLRIRVAIWIDCQHRYCHLVKQRLKQVVIRTVNQDDLGRRLPERFGGG